MALTPQYISQFISDQFPSHFRDEHSALVEFVLAYYEWLEETGQTQSVSRNLLSNRDIDLTVDGFIKHFNSTFFAGSALQNASDPRFILKHISDLYQSKGSIRSIELLIRLMFGEEVEIFLPSDRIFTSSDSVWVKPSYIEIDDTDRAKDFIGKSITGSNSGATGFVESVVTKVVAQKRITIAYLSSVVGTFTTGEYVTDDGELENAPKIVGSLSNITITNGGSGFAIGDIFDVVSPTGRGAQARVSSVEDATGRVNFSIANGGYGYTVSNTYTRTLSSNATIVIENKASSNVDIEDFYYFETITQPIANVTYLDAGSNTDFLTYANATLINGANLYGNGSLNDANVASGYILDTAANTLIIITHSGDFSLSDYIYVTTAATNVQVDTVTDDTVTGEFIGQRYVAASNTWVIGLNANNKPFYANVAGAFVYGASSNVYANSIQIGTGTAADFEVGALGIQETVSLFTDRISDFNTANVQFINVVVEGSNSGIGSVDTITIDTQLSIDTLANTQTPFAANGGFIVGDTIWAANVYVNTIALISGGTGYSNADTVVFTGGSPGTVAVANVTTWGNGTINFWTLSNKGADYEGQPAITITTGGGTGANLYAIMSADGAGAQGIIESQNTTALIIKGISNGSFSTATTITNNQRNAFANISAITSLGGANYAPGDTIALSGNATATVTVSANAITGFVVTDPGSEYLVDAAPTITTGAGSGANITVNMDWGYGFTKSADADLTTILYDALTFASFTIGEIVSLSGVNPGAGYNLDPEALAHNPYVSGYNRRDIVCVVGNLSGTYQSGESLTQTLALPGYLVLHSNATSNGITLNGNSDPILIGEGVVQFTTLATGVIESSNSTYIKIRSVNGAFTDAYDIQTQSSLANVTPFAAGVTEEDVTEIATGQFKSVITDPGDPNKHLVKIRRLSFGQSFLAGATLTGSSSGATSNVLSAYDDGDTLPIGLNADITANVATANGVVATLEIINSGYGYESGATIQLQSNNTEFIVSGTAVVEEQGRAAGRWETRKSFSSDVSKLQDNNYYQEYSYVIRTGIALDKYSDIVKDILHVAGTKLFGEVVKVGDFTALSLDSAESSIVAANTYESWMG